MTVYLISPVPRKSSPQRPHNLAEQFLVDGHRVVWLEPQLSLSSLYRLFTKGKPMTVLREMSQKSSVTRTVGEIEKFGLFRSMLLSVLTLLPNRLQALLRISKLLGIDELSTVLVMNPSRLASGLLYSHLGDSHFDVLDNYMEFSKIRRKSIQKNFLTTLSIARTVSVSSFRLQQLVAESDRESLLLRNACHDSAERHSKTRDKSQIAKKAVYVGTVGSWFDWAWLTDFASENPQIAIDIFGPVHYRFPQVSNLSVNGPIDRDLFFERSDAYSIGLIPFKINALTEAVDPVKLYEYLGLGLSVISTPLPEVKKVIDENGWHDLVQIQSIPSPVRSFSSNSGYTVPSWTDRYALLKNYR